jgi:hypothetical protein
MLMRSLSMRLFPALFVTMVGTSVPLVACRDTPREQIDDAAAASASASIAPAPSVAPSGSVGVNTLPIPSASVAAVVNPRGLPAYEGPVGSVEGTITIEGDHAPDVTGLDFTKCPGGVKAYGKLFREGTPLPNGARPLADALVGVTDYAPGFFVPERTPAVKASIDGCEFTPHTITMTFGQRLEIMNNTKLVIAPALDRAPTPALLIAPPEAHGDPVKLYPPHPGYFTMLDRMDLAFLSADVYVLMHPFHTATGFDGHYRIDGIPAGKAKVFSRLRAIGREAAKDVDVVAGKITKVDIVIRYDKRDAGAPAVDAGPRPKIIP